MNLIAGIKPPCRQRLRVQCAASSTTSAGVVPQVKAAVGNCSASSELNQLILRHSIPGFKYSSDLWTCADIDRFEASIKSWRTRSEELAVDYSEQIVSVSQLSKDKLVVKWRARWVPKALKWLDDGGRAWPGMRVEYYDVLQLYGERTQFRWRALFKLLSSALATGVLRIPESAIEGQTEMTITEAGEVQSANDTIWIVPMFRSFRVKNRRIAKDMLLWQEMRQPAGVSFQEWDERFMADLHIEDVPGMGQFDIDGLDDSERDDNYANVLLLMGMVTVLLISFGVSYGMVHMQSTQADQYLLDSYRMLVDTDNL